MPTVIDDRNEACWSTGDKVAVSEHGSKKIEGSQLLLPPSVVAVVKNHMEMHEKVYQALVDAVILEAPPKSSKKKKSAPQKSQGLEKLAQPLGFKAPAKKQSSINNTGRKLF